MLDCAHDADAARMARHIQMSKRVDVLMAHMKTKIAEYGVVIKDNKFLMLRFSRETNPSEKWIFPGGRLDEGENPKTALVREIKEETGLDVELLHPCDVTMWGVNDDHRYAIFFLCKLEGDDNVQLSHEHQEYTWFGFDELQNIAFHTPSFKEVLENARKMVESLNL